MSLKENGSRMAVFGAAVAAGLVGAPEQAEAGEFANYCAPIANGEILDTELTPQNMGYIFDENGNVIGSRADELTQYYGDGITEECGTGDIGAYVEQTGQQVLLVVYPPGQYPLGIAPETFQEIQASYAACVGEALDFADENENGIIEPGLEARYLEEDKAFCDDRAAGDIKIAQLDQQIADADQQIADADQQIAEADQRIADADQRIAASQARQDAMFANWTREILNGS